MKLKKTIKLAGLILAKKESKRLLNKNILDFHGEPMFLVNVKKCLEIFEKVFVSSDDHDILRQSGLVGAIPILRGKKLCKMPNIPVYQHALKRMENFDGIVAVQANSPTIKPKIIKRIKVLLESGIQEVMSCHKDGSIYGSVWGINRKKLENYGDPYKPKPSILIEDLSIDIHYLEDYNKALCQKF